MDLTEILQWELYQNTVEPFQL